MPFIEDDEYESPAQATARIAAALPPVLNDLTLDAGESTLIVEFGVFNDAEFWEPLFTSGELDASQRFQLDAPLHSTGSLRSAVRFADLRNAERAQQAKVDKYGYTVVRTRTIVQSPWGEVSYDDIDEARGR